MVSMNNFQTIDFEELKENFRIILSQYLENEDEEILYKAYILAHDAILSNVSLLDLVSIYQKAITEIIFQNPQNKDLATSFSESLRFLSETLTPFEMTIRGYKDAIYQLKSKTLILEQERVKIDHIVNRLESGLLVLDKTGEILLINSALQYYFLKYFKLDISNGLNIKEISHNILSETILSCYNKFENDTFDIELTDDFYLKVVCNVLFMPDKKQNNPLFLVIEFHDVSTFLQFDKLRNSFISMVSHELRSPISSISLSIKNMITHRDRLKPQDQQKLEQIILANSDLMIEIIEDLLLISKIDEKKMSLNYENFLLDNAIRNVQLQLTQKLETKSLVIEKEVDLNLVIEADKQRTEQIIRIILDNAIKYSFDNNKIVIQVKEVIVKELPWVSILIQDFGRGMSESDLNNLFQRFFRSKNVRNIHGTGLGLAIAKELITLQRGQIDVVSRLGEGSTFIIKLPLKKLDENRLN